LLPSVVPVGFFIFSESFFLFQNFRLQSGEYAEQQAQGRAREVASQQVLHRQKPGGRQSSGKVSSLNNLTPGI
jgi:hypothetical protein